MALLAEHEGVPVAAAGAVLGVVVESHSGSGRWSIASCGRTTCYSGVRRWARPTARLRLAYHSDVLQPGEELYAALRIQARLRRVPAARAADTGTSCRPRSTGHTLAVTLRRALHKRRRRAFERRRERERERQDAAPADMAAATAQAASQQPVEKA
jgi:hypothetical protein